MPSNPDAPDRPDDGGPAFPQNDAAVNRANNEAGMTLHDYYVGKALQGLLARSWHGEGERFAPFCFNATECDEFASTASMLADAAMRQRSARLSPRRVQP